MEKCIICFRGIKKIKHINHQCKCVKNIVHQKCYYKWLKISPTCPLCRRIVKRNYRLLIKSFCKKNFNRIILVMITLWYLYLYQYILDMNYMNKCYKHNSAF